MKDPSRGNVQNFHGALPGQRGSASAPAGVLGLRAAVLRAAAPSELAFTACKSVHLGHFTPLQEYVFLHRQAVLTRSSDATPANSGHLVNCWGGSIFQ